MDDGSQAVEAANIGERVLKASEVGMANALWAQLQPDKVAIYGPDSRTRTFGDLNANANRIARLLRGAGLRAGDGLALVCTNRIEFAEVTLAALRIGLRMTPVNWHLTADEIAYIVSDCQAKALFADVRIPQVQAAAANCPAATLKVSIGGHWPGFVGFDEAIAGFEGSDIADPVRGFTMLYTSGTTGRPKGVEKPGEVGTLYDPAYDRGCDIHMLTGPAYHAAPYMSDMRRPLANGVPVIFLDAWDSEVALCTIERMKVTHTHLVPIMFQRLLALPPQTRALYDLSSLKRVNHGAAPCPPDVKRAMIGWFGPVLREYYAGSEGSVGFLISSEEWLTKPGSVGRRVSPDIALALDEDGAVCPTGVSGAIYLKIAEAMQFRYFNDPEKTDAGRRGDYFTLGDVGYFDEDDYLFLTGRSAETIISGGVNIYPQEIDNALMQHPAVADACTIGAPNDEWGEEVRAVIQLMPGTAPSEALKVEILAAVATSLARFKIPRAIDFVAELPRTPAGKVLRGKVRQPFWEGRTRQI